MAFKARTSKPEAGNKYYITKAKGGYSAAIQGNPTDKDCDVLSNCVGYAYGRFNEIGGWGCCKYLWPTNAENFMQYKGSCETGMTPEVGAVMVWQKGATLSGSDGAGHVAVVEKVISPTEVFTSESGWGSSAFWNQTRKKGSGNWGANSNYKFLGFIYNPAIHNKKDAVTDKEPTITNPVSRDTSKNQIQVLVSDLNVRTGAGTGYKSLGTAKKGYYNYTDSKSANGYVWYEIGESNWIAANSSWTKIHVAKPEPVMTSPVARDESKDQLQIVIPNLRVRTGAGNNKTTLGLAKKGYYNYTAVKQANGYTWYKIAESNWIAYGPKWVNLYPAKKDEVEVYTVKKGDSLFSIAEKFNTTWQKLAEYNYIKNPSFIQIGQKIKIPK